MTFISILLTVMTVTQTAKIDRKAVLDRNNPKVEAADTLSSLTVGNGSFAATVDVTGLQSFPEQYSGGVPLTTMTAWGWHSFPNTEQLTEKESQQTVDAGHGHGEIYAVEYKTAGRNKDATEYFRVNPHRLNLGCLGLVFSDAKGNTLNLSSVSGISQVLKLWEGIVESDYTVSDSPVKVVTGSNGDALLARIVTPLFAKRQARLALRLPYPTGKHSDDASDWASVARHTSRIVSSTSQHALIEHRIDDTRYFVSLRWNGRATLSNTSSHVFTLTPLDNIIDVAVSYSSSEKGCATSPLTLDSDCHTLP